MTPFEEQLKQALARQEPSADFTSRVLAEAARQERQKEARGWRAWFRKGWFQAPLMQAWRLAPVMAAFLVMSGVVAYREHQREVQGQAAKQQLLQALQDCRHQAPPHPAAGCGHGDRRDRVAAAIG